MRMNELEEIQIQMGGVIKKRGCISALTFVTTRTQVQSLKKQQVMVFGFLVSLMFIYVETMKSMKDYESEK